MRARVSFSFSLALSLAAALCALLGGVPQLYAGTTLFVSDTTFGPTDFVHAFDAVTGAPQAPDISLFSPTGLAIGLNGNLYVTNTNPGLNNSGSVFQYNPVTHAQIGGPVVTFNGQNDGHDVIIPQGMRTAPNGNLYIADAGGDQNVHIYDPAGNSLGTLSSNQLLAPQDVAFDASGNLYVPSGNADVLRSAGGTGPLTEFVAQQAGGLINPVSLSFAPSGELYVLDIGGNFAAIRRYDASGQGDGASVNDATVISFSGNLFSFVPSDILFGPDGKLYVSGQDTFQNPAGEILRFLADGTPDGVFISGLSNPTYMAFAVPEPSSIALLSIATVCAALSLAARRRQDL